MTRISRRVREEAILICEIAASTPDLAESYAETAHALGIDIDWCSDAPSADLAYLAWEACSALPRDGVDAEAAALLRDGWCPGDHVQQAG